MANDPEKFDTFGTEEGGTDILGEEAGGTWNSLLIRPPATHPAAANSPHRTARCYQDDPGAPG
jgi:hypothetical protein